MRTPLRFLMIATAVLLGTVEISSAASSHHPARTARQVGPAVGPAPVQGSWCLYYHTGGANCQFSDFPGCMYMASAHGGNCQLSPSWRAQYGNRLPPRDQWMYSGPCVDDFDARCYRGAPAQTWLAL
jgi:hypothetical protein